MGAGFTNGQLAQILVNEKQQNEKMKKLHILLIAILISLSIFAFTNLQVKAVTLNLSAVASDSPIDAGGSSVLSVSIIGGSGTYTYQWISGGPWSNRLLKYYHKWE